MSDLPKRRTDPKQRRSRETVTSIVEATREILKRGRPEEITTQAIAERAGIGIASLYRYFPNLDAIIVEICAAELRPHAQRHEALLQRARESPGAIAGLPLAARLRVVCEESVRVQRRLVRLLGPEFYVRYFHSVSEATGVSTREGVQLMRLHLADRAEEVSVADLDLAAQVIQALVSGGVATLVSDASEDTPDQALSDALLQMVLRYLGVPLG